MAIRLRSVAALVVVLAAVVATAAPASADPISDKKAEARRITKRIDDLQNYAETLTEQYNGDLEELAKVNKEVDDAKAKLAAQDVSIGTLKSKLSVFAVRTYVYGDQVASPVSAVADPTGAGAAQRQAYSSLFLGTNVDAADEMAAVREDTARLKDQLATKQKRQGELTKKVDGQRKAVEKAIADAQSYESKLQGDVAKLVAQERERQRQASLLAVQARISRGRTVGVPGSGRSVPPPSAGAAGAIAAARSQLGVPYRFAAASPGVAFDCSGLTMWAWGRAGVGMPHFAASQYYMFPKVPIDAMAPGDLVFFGSPIHHVGIYIGNGLMIDAPQTGDVVGVHALYRGFVGAARP